MPKVTIYSTPTCPYCKMAIQFLQEHNIPFQEKDVSSDQTALEMMVQKTGQMGVPVIEVDDQIIIGYSESELRKALGI